MTKRKPYQPKTGERCGCKPGVYRDNCPACEGTGWKVDFRAIRAQATKQSLTPFLVFDTSTKTSIKVKENKGYDQTDVGQLSRTIMESVG